MQNDDTGVFGTAIPKEPHIPGVEITASFKQKDIEKKPQSFTQWAQVLDGKFVITGSTMNKLPSGAYEIQTTDSGFLFTKQTLHVDELIDFDDSKMSAVLEEIGRFWDRHSIFQQYKFLHRRGYLFYGPAGSGKTCLVQQIIADIVRRDGLAFYINTAPRIAADGLRDALRRVEPDRPIVCVLEDIDAIIRYHGESDVLSFLDGEIQVDRIITIATTNYPEQLDRRIIARPRRFDRLVYVGMPDANIRRKYFKSKLLNMSDDEIEQWVDISDEFSFAALSDLIISVKCLGNDLQTTAKQLADLLKSKPSSEKFNEPKERFGFS